MKFISENRGIVTMYAYLDKSIDWNNFSSTELWEIFKKGNRSAFSELFSRFYPRLFRYGISLVSDTEIVKDGIQELFLTLWRNKAELSDAKSVEFYLLISLKRILFREKKKQTSRQIINLEFISGFGKAELGVESHFIHLENKKERLKLYQKALQTLTDRQREALMLRMEYGLDNSEIAEFLNLSEKRIRNLIWKATKILREWVANHENLQLKIN